MIRYEHLKIGFAMLTVEKIEKYISKDRKLRAAKVFEIIDFYKLDLDFFLDFICKHSIKITEPKIAAREKNKLLNELESLKVDNSKITCKQAAQLSKKYGFKELGTALKQYNIKFRYSKEKRADKAFFVRTKTWIENEDGELLFGKGQIELLKFVEEEGSILKAAKRMGISYKKAWLHLQSLQDNTKEVLIFTKQGRSKDSGTKLSPKALELMGKYVRLQKEVNEYANKKFKEFFIDC